MDLDRLYALQLELAKKVSLEDGFSVIEKIAGCDVAFIGQCAFAAAVVLHHDTMELLKKKVVERVVDFPYIPTLLAFRELEPLRAALKGLDFDVLMVDGQGIAHPRGLGIASHIGVLAAMPTIGVAKSILCGEVVGKPALGRPSPLVYEGRLVGYAAVTKSAAKPIYISPGHMVSPESAMCIALSCLREYRLPEPTRLAHQLATEARREKL